jgi:hypothetical protein
MGTRKTFDGTPEERAACEVIREIADSIVSEAVDAGAWDSSIVMGWDDHDFGDGPEFFLKRVRQIAVALWPEGRTARAALDQIERPTISERSRVIERKHSTS